LKNWELSQSGITSYDAEVQEPENKEIEKNDDYYSSLSKKDLEKEIDDALDANDMERVKRIAKFLNESQKIKIAKRMYPDQGYPSLDF
jgi:uncharacterized protein YpiB (UPF0302 family)